MLRRTGDRGYKRTAKFDLKSGGITSKLINISPKFGFFCKHYQKSP